MTRRILLICLPLVYLLMLCQRTAAAEQLLRHGRYEVGIARGNITGKPGRITISRNGKQLLIIRDQLIVHAEIRALSSHRASDLFVETFSGGAHCCTTFYVFGLGPRLRTLLVFNARNYDIITIKDLDHDGRQEIIAGDDSFAYYATSFAKSPSLPFILGYEKGRYRDTTARYRWFVKADQVRAKEKLAHTIRAVTAAQRDNETSEDIKRGSINVYGDALLLGAAQKTREWIRHRVPAQEWKWFLGAQADIELTVRERVHKIAYTVRTHWQRPYWERMRRTKGFTEQHRRLSTNRAIPEKRLHSRQRRNIRYAPENSRVWTNPMAKDCHGRDNSLSPILGFTRWMWWKGHHNFL